MNDRDFLCWIHERLEHQLGDSPLTDFMHKLRSIIKATPPRRNTPNVGGHGNSLEELRKQFAKKEKR